MKKIYSIIVAITFIFPLFFVGTPDAGATVLCTVPPTEEFDITRLGIKLHGETVTATHIIRGAVSSVSSEVTASIRIGGATATPIFTLASQVAVARNAESICAIVMGIGGAISAGIKEGCDLSKPIKLPDGRIIPAGDVGPTTTAKWGVVCLINTVNILTDWAFFILLTLAFVFIAAAGFIWMTAGSNPDKQKLAGQIIAAALIGIVIAILARVIPAVITGILL